MNEIITLETQGVRTNAFGSLPNHLIQIIFSTASSQDDLRSLRLVNKAFHAAATASVRSMTPMKAMDLLPRFPGLEAIDFSLIPAQCAWSESTLACLQQAKKLTSIKFGRTTQLTPSGAAIIANIKQLRSIECIDVQLTDSAFRHWSTLTNLTSLSLLGCRQLSATALHDTIGSLNTLESVELGSCCGVDDGVLAALGALPKLHKVDLSSCDNFTETGLAALGHAESLKTLLVPACWQIDDTMMKTLSSSMPNLVTLSLFEAGEGVTDAGLLYLTTLVHLTGLDLGYSCWAHTSDGLERVLSSLPALKMLNIGGAEGVTDTVLATVASKLTALTMLDISECQRTTATDVQQLSQLKFLKELHLGWNLKMEDCALSTLPTGLTKLDLSYCGSVSLTSLTSNSLPELSSLHLRRCPLVTDASLAALALAAPNLEHLDISYCLNVTSSGLRCLSTLNKLVYLNISACVRAATVIGLGYLQAVPKLTSLEASHLARFDNGCMQAVSFVSQLRHLKFKECPRITDHGLLALLRIPKLISLEMDGRNVTRDAVEKLQVRLVCLRRVRITFKEWNTLNACYERDYNGGFFGSYINY